jgi:hypothetical protein
MSTTKKTHASLAVLAASLLLNFVLVSCAAESTAPPQAMDQEVLARLDAVMTRLTAIEAKLDVQEDTMKARFDSLRSTITVGGPGGGPVGGPSALVAAQVDSLVALASFIAHDITSGAWEVCGGAELALGGSSKTAAEVEGKALGSLGAWAGLGGFAGADIKTTRDLGLEIGLEGNIGIEGCVPLGAETPPARMIAGQAHLIDQTLHSSLGAVTSQVGLTRERISQSFSTIGTAFQSPGTIRVQDAISILPLPSGLQAIMSDPVGRLSSEVPAKIDEALDALCTRNWGPRASTPIGTACDRIASNTGDIGGLFGMMEQFPQVQAAVSTVSDGVSTICTRMNSIGTRSLTIPNPLEIGPTNLFGPSRLFPSYTNMTC